jgi:hypothetical protein
MLLKRLLPVFMALLVAPLAVYGQTFDTIYEYGNAASANATSGAGMARGFTSAAGTYTITAGGTDFWDVSDHGSAIFDSTAAAVTGDFSAVVQVSIGLPGETMPDEWGRAGLMARTDPAAANSAYFASTQKFDGAAGDPARRQHILQFRDSLGAGTSRVSDGSSTTLITGPSAAATGGSAVPVWLGLHRYGDQIFSTWAPDVAGAPGTWSAAEARVGTADHLGPVQLGLFHQNHNVQPQTSTATFTGFSAGAFDNTLGDFPLAITRAPVALNAEGKVVGSFSGMEVGGGPAQAVDWKVELLGAPTTVPGLFARSYLRGNSGGNFDPDSLTAQGSGIIPNIAWWGNANPAPAGFEKYPDVLNLPADTNSPGDNQENYSVDVQGQLFIPEAGTYKFKDGVDDYTYLAINGDVLIDDNNWTGPNGSDNGGSPIVEKTFDAPGWVDITFRMAEGGGGDAGTLYWDYNNTDFPATQTAPAGTGALIPAENFRYATYEVTGELSDTSIMNGEVLMDGAGNMLTATPGTLARVTVNGVSQVVTLVPEPSAICLSVLSALGLLGLRRRRR